MENLTNDIISVEYFILAYLTELIVLSVEYLVTTHSDNLNNIYYVSERSSVDFTNKQLSVKHQ